MLGAVVIKISLASNEAHTAHTQQYKVSMNAMKKAELRPRIFGFCFEGSVGIMKQDIQVVQKFGGDARVCMKAIQAEGGTCKKRNTV